MVRMTVTALVALLILSPALPSPVWALAAYPDHPKTSPDITAADLSARDKDMAAKH